MNDPELNEGTEKQPQRRCIICRSNGRKVTLLRFALFHDTLCFDLRHKLPGRGYYVCAQERCLEKAFSGGLKKQTKHDISEIAPNASVFIEEILIPGLRKRYKECIQAGFQSHQLLVGADSVEQAAMQDQLLCYVLATDASESTAQKYRMNAERKGISCFGMLDRAGYGSMLGKTERVVLGWHPGALGEEFMALETALKRLENRNAAEQNVLETGKSENSELK